MSANKKPRKKYRPKPVLANTLEYVTKGFRPLSATELLRLRTAQHSSMERLVTGKAERNDWDDICGMINMCIALCEMGIGKEYITEVQAAMVAHAKCGARLHKHGKFGYSGEELQAVNTVFDIHEAQLVLATLEELETAQRVIRQAYNRQHFFTSVSKELRNATAEQASV